MESQLINYLKSLKPISDTDENIITEHFTSKTFKEGDFLILPNKIAKEMFFVCSGVLRIGSTNDKGIELTHYFYNEDRFASILQSFNEETPTSAFIQASCPTEVLSITRNRLLELYEKLPYMKELIDQQNQLRLIEKVNIRNTYLGEDAEGKYKLFMTQHPDIILRIPLKDIASYLGITPQSLSRIRRNIK
ncbi:Crp/Fnr family transcriptional regulator [Pedobacter sp. L105]|uniref:Crp/Fnr family transcriptional regulator n=1 Tax=Pedobacter sp. L105 TaxID=1641871 RepID=UPI00131E1C3B|nr:Crp/Fnr family transcriptional regulator [Pedobacter sp. L105]